MKYVYILKSLSDPTKRYSGITSDLKQRLAEHNRGASLHTAAFVPWIVDTYIGFSDKKKAINFERYLKGGSGKAFSKKRL